MSSYIEVKLIMIQDSWQPCLLYIRKTYVSQPIRCLFKETSLFISRSSISIRCLCLNEQVVVYKDKSPQ